MATNVDGYGEEMMFLDRRIAALREAGEEMARALDQLRDNLADAEEDKDDNGDVYPDVARCDKALAVWRKVAGPRE